jgi:hypothetical protein
MIRDDENIINEEVTVLEQENIKRIVLCFTCLFISMTIFLFFGYSLPVPFKTPYEAIGGLVVVVFFFVGLWHFSKINYINLWHCFICQLNIYSKRDVRNKSAEKIALIGMVLFPIAIYYRDGVFLAPLIIWSIMIFLEDSVVVKAIFSYSSSKKIFAFLSSCVVFWATYTTFGQVNTVFGVDPTYFPFAITVGIFINIIKVAIFPSIVVAPLSVIFLIINAFTSKHPFWSVSRQYLLSCTFILSSFMLLMFIYVKSDDFIQKKILESAEVMDMNNNHHCHSKDLLRGSKKLPVVFLGPNSSLVLYKNNGKFDIADCNPLNSNLIP